MVGIEKNPQTLEKRRVRLKNERPEGPLSALPPAWPAARKAPAWHSRPKCGKVF